MVFRESTHRFSSFFVHKPMIGREIPLASSLGQAYLAFSSESVRKPMLQAFAADWNACGFGRINAAEADRILQKVRSKGYATAIGSLEPGVAAVAMPIIFGGQVLACMNVVTTPEVCYAKSLIQPIQDRLQKTVRLIEQQIQRDWPQ